MSNLYLNIFEIDIFYQIDKSSHKLNNIKKDSISLALLRIHSNLLKSCIFLILTIKRKS